MKKTVLFLLIAAFFHINAYSKSLGLGGKATLTDVKMQDVSGEKVSLNDVAKSNGLLVIFSSNTCPFVQQWESRYSDAKNWADQHNVGMIVLNSNYQNRDGVDSFSEMKKRASEQRYNFHYAVDEDSQIANAFGGQTTPHVFLFNGNMELVYKGAIDDNYKSAKEVKHAYVKDAITSLARGEKVAVAETKPVGCGIKRKLD
ncbi:AhpC/TSA family protein [Mariniphaga anaerophila]|uniref:AhpC/TSA family protein n=1 Tax=Mariniphaga anaerophila TaxID=1484053 RepID=A0A1M4SHL2_9BACT|nr:redoxin domain-containing protein [Mariniphaga anaerophila]SHE31680.1 AhpC/TSA family protein [Mariniphaga anaerophila]